MNASTKGNDLRRGFHIGEWDVFPLEGNVDSGNRTIHLEPKVMEVLLALAEQSEQVVLRESLLEKIWGARAAVSDEPLTRCIAQLRQALGDSSREPAYVQTVPKRGYRLMQPALALSVSEAPATQAETHLESVGSDRLGKARALPYRTAILVIVAAAALFWLVQTKLTNEESAIEAGAAGLGLPPAIEVTPGSEGAGAWVDEAKRLVQRRTRQSLHDAIRDLEHAIEEDENNGEAYLLMAKAYALLPYYDTSENAADDYVDAFKYLTEGQARDPSIAQRGYAIAAYVKFRQWDWAEAERLFDLASNATPDDADMWRWKSDFLASVGRINAALEAAHNAYVIGGDNPVNLDRYAFVSLLAGDLQQAERLYLEMAERFPDAMPNADIQIVYFIQAGRLDDAERLVRSSQYQQLPLAPDSWVDPFFEYLADRNDEVARTRAVAKLGEAYADSDITPKYAFAAYIYLRQDEESLAVGDFLRENSKNELQVQFLFGEEARFMRGNAHYRQLLEDLGLMKYWEATGNWPDDETICREIDLACP